MKHYSSSHDILVNSYEYFNKFLMTALLWMSRVTSRLHCAIRNLWIDESFHFCAGRVVKNVQNKPLNASTLEPSIVTLKSFIKVEWNSCRFNFTSETLLTSLDAHRGHGGHKKNEKSLATRHRTSAEPWPSRPTIWPFTAVAFSISSPTHCNLAWKV